VAAFLDEKIAWSAIPDVLDAVHSRHDGSVPEDVDAVIAADAQARAVAGELIEGMIGR
jgi:1-deoxy-D-xylulose 5-phosphate reductoisomerase